MTFHTVNIPSWTILLVRLYIFPQKLKLTVLASHLLVSTLFRVIFDLFVADPVFTLPMAALELYGVEQSVHELRLTFSFEVPFPAIRTRLLGTIAHPLMNASFAENFLTLVAEFAVPDKFQADEAGELINKALVLFLVLDRCEL